MNPCKLFIVMIVGSSFLGCRHQTPQQQPAGICAKETRQLLHEYLSQPEYYQDQDFIEEFLNALALNDLTATDQLEKKNREIKYAIEMDSLWRLFTEEDDFEQNGDSTKAERYRLIIFTDLLNLIEIYRIEKEKASSKLFHKKIRLVCQPPILSGKALEKSCFKIIHSVKQVISQSEEAEIKAIIQETGFWQLPSLRYHRGCFDGSSWELEILKDGKYKKMSSYCPAKYDPVYLIGSLMIAQTK